MVDEMKEPACAGSASKELARSYFARYIPWPTLRAAAALSNLRQEGPSGPGRRWTPVDTSSGRGAAPRTPP